MKPITTLLLVSCGLALLQTACTHEGPAEKLGKKIDNATQDVRDEARQAADKAEHKLDQAADAADAALDKAKSAPPTN